MTASPVVAQRELLLGGSAELSPCLQYRYTLTRVWDEYRPRVLWVMLNPSTADGDTDDPTIRKCVGFARRWDAGAIEVVNLYAFRATDPRALRAAGSPVGPENDARIAAAVGRADVILCAWGAHEPASTPRTERVRALIGGRGRVAYCLGRAAGGQPRHPLMLAYVTPRQPFWAEIGGARG